MTDPLSAGAANEATKLLPEVYKDLVQPSLKEVGSITGRSVKFLLAPVRDFLWGWEKIEQMVEAGINKRLQNVPEENHKTPEPEIAVPLMQALTYTAQNETLREMYLNLLASAMDARKDKVVHPSFVEIIKQMNSLDAKLFDQLTVDKAFKPLIKPRISIQSSKKFFTDALPELFTGIEIVDYNIFDLSTSLVKLSKFGLIDYSTSGTINSYNYHPLIEHKDLMSILNIYKSEFGQETLTLDTEPGYINVNGYGWQFKTACSQ